MHPKLQVKLNEKAAQYAKVTAFAKVLPMYADVIIENEYTGDMYHRLGHRYKELYFAWDIAWQVHKPTNFPEDRTYEEGTICIYVNCMSIFNEDLYHMAQSKLNEHMQDTPVYFYDGWNSTFYFKPNEIENGLEDLRGWYLDTKANIDAFLKEKRRKELQAELAKLDK